MSHPKRSVNEPGSGEKRGISKRQVLFLFLAHFFILFGMAHAGAFLGVLELIYFPYFDFSAFRLVPEGEADAHLPAAGFWGFLGNLFLAGCFLVKLARLEKTLYILGVLSYLVSIGYLARSQNVQFSPLFCIPFFAAVVYGIAKPNLHRLQGWLRN